LDDIAEVDGVDGGWIDVGGVDCCFGGDRTQFGRGELLEGAAEGSECCPLCGDDVNIRHGETLLCFVLLTNEMRTMDD